MRAVAVFPRTQEIKVIEREEPQITQPDQVKVRMFDIGICGTDHMLATFTFGEPPKDEEYLVVGHENLGQIIEIGPSASRFRVGDLITIRPLRPCSHVFCRPCRYNRPDYCITNDFLTSGIWRRHGFMTEVVIEQEHYLHTVPPVLREIGVLIQPLAIAEKALIDVKYIQQRFPWTLSCTSSTLGAGLTALNRS